MNTKWYDYKFVNPRTKRSVRFDGTTDHDSSSQFVKTSSEQHQ